MNKPTQGQRATAYGFYEQMLTVLTVNYTNQVANLKHDRRPDVVEKDVPFDVIQACPDQGRE